MRVKYSNCPFGTWEIALARPHPRLRRGVYGYRGFWTKLPEPRRWLGLPGGVVSLVLGFDTDWRLSVHDLADDTEKSFTSLVAGLDTKARIYEHRGSAYGLDVALAPWVAFTAFGVDMGDLAGAVVEFDHLLSDRVHQLTSALVALPDWEQRFQLLDDVLSTWIGSGCAWSPQVEWAYNELIRSRGTIPVRKLAEGAGWSRRQLEYLFREQVGLSPKSTARVIRFRNVVRLLTAGWTPLRTATACGFSDQAHLTREFKTFTGLTPNRFRVMSQIGADALAAAVHGSSDVRTLAVLGG